MQCPDCGAFITEEDLFCGECGRPLPGKPATSGDLPPADTGQVTETRTLAPPPPLPPPATRVKRSNWVLIAVGAGTVFVLICGCAAVLLGRSLITIDRAATVIVDTPMVVVDTAVAIADTPMVSIPISGSLLLADDFSDPTSGWDVYSEDDTESRYADGEYELAVYRDNYVTWANPAGQEFTDLQVEVDARTVEGPLDNSLGILVRYQPDDDNFYWFQISADGYYSVDMLQAGEWVGLVDWTESAAINQGLGATNHLAVTCAGDQFTFYVNDTYLTSMSDATFEAGNVGLAAGTFDEAGAVVHFDNLEIYSLQE
jgi:hypothetical protein